MLSKETKDQIRKEAEDYGESFQEISAYIAGATVWASWKEKAEMAKTALEKISNLKWATDGRKFDGDHKGMLKIAVDYAAQALESFNQNKVK